MPTALNSENFSENGDAKEITSIEKSEKPKKEKKKWGGLFIVIILIIAVLAGGYFLWGYSSYKAAGDLIFFSSSDKIYIAYDNGKKAEIDGTLYNSQTSLDGKKGAALVNYSENKGTLYYFDGLGEPALISENVSDFIVSDSGDSVIFYTEYDDWNKIADLSVYKNGAVNVIDHEAFFSMDNNIGSVISPDGETVFYIKNVNALEWSNGSPFKSTSFISTSGAPGVEFSGGSNCIPVAVSDNADYIYYLLKGNSGEELFVNKGTASEAIRLCEGGVTKMSFNEDYSQLVYVEGKGSLIKISVEGGEGKTILDGTIRDFIVPQNSQRRVGSYATVYGFSSFKNKAFSSDTGLFIIDKNFDRVRVSKSAEVVTLSKNGRRIMYLDGSNLKTTSMMNPNKESPLLVENIQNYVLVSGGSFYYVDMYGDLYRQTLRGARSKAEGVWLSSLANPLSLCVSSKGTVYFVDFDGDAISVKGTDLKKAVGGAERVVSDMNVYNNCVFYSVRTSDTTCNLFRSGGNGVFETFADEIIISGENTSTIVDEDDDDNYERSGDYYEEWD